MIKYILLLLLCGSGISQSPAQSPVRLENFNKKNGVGVKIAGDQVSFSWPAGGNENGRLVLNLNNANALFKSIGLSSNKISRTIVDEMDPAFILTVGKRDLVSQNGWNIFFDKVPSKPFRAYKLEIDKKQAVVSSVGSRTVIRIDEVKAPGFTGQIEITLFNGSPLMNIAAVVTTAIDSTAIVYDAGLVSKEMKWSRLAWANVNDSLQSSKPGFADTAVNQAVKYRTIIGETGTGSVAVFPAPHQYFYPLDEAFNLRFVWHGNQYRKMIDGYGIGIRQDLYGDRRFVPWFNSPPNTRQRLNFFCLLSVTRPLVALEKVKQFTHNDKYIPLAGYKTLASHFHNEFVMKVVLAGKPIPDTPSFVKVFKNTGVDIVHLGEFHYTAHPKGPDETRLKELHALFQQCERLSDGRFLLLPGEEPNEFLGGHWLQFFPRPVYWIMSRKEGQPMVSVDSVYGKVYRIGNAEEMLKLLEEEKGLAWTAHPRTKGSTGYPDKYKTEPFFRSDRFLGAAWKPIPADLSLTRLGVRVLDLLDDMSNWGYHKKILAEADLFTIEPENEMYAHLNVNYLQLDKLPAFKSGWQSVTDALEHGRFFSSTGEVLIPSFKVNGKGSGDSLTLGPNGDALVNFELQWTFPMLFAELVSGDGKSVFRHKISLDTTMAFGKKKLRVPINLKGRKWVRLEAWDIAANGAFTQTIWLN
jgi:hypothetical protein